MVRDGVKQNWADEFWTKIKLHRHCEIKSVYYTENYLYKLSKGKKKRSLCAQIRGGMLPLQTETDGTSGWKKILNLE